MALLGDFVVVWCFLVGQTEQVKCEMVCHWGAEDATHQWKCFFCWLTIMHLSFLLLKSFIQRKNTDKVHNHYNNVKQIRSISTNIKVTHICFIPHDVTVSFCSVSSCARKSDGIITVTHNKVYAFCYPTVQCCHCKQQQFCKEKQRMESKHQSKC